MATLCVSNCSHAFGRVKQTYTAALAAAVGGRCAEGDDWRWGEGDRRGGGEEEEEEEEEE